MIAHSFSKLVAGLGMLTAMVGSAFAQSPTSFAESYAEANAYNYSYISMVMSNGLADVMADDGLEGEVAQLINDRCTDAFFHCYDALVDNDNSQWSEAVDDLESALLWCDTLVVFASDSQPSSVQAQIEQLMWYLEIALANAEDAVPVRKYRYLTPIYPTKSTTTSR